MNQRTFSPKPAALVSRSHHAARCLPPPCRIRPKHARKPMAPSASSGAGLQRVPSNRDLRPPNAPAPIALTLAQLDTLLSTTNGGSVYAGGVVANAEELAKALGTSLRRGIPSGEQERTRRVATYGSNTLPARPRTSFAEYVAEALDDFTVRILIAAGLVSIVLEAVLDGGQGDGTGWIEGAAILAAVVVVVLVTAVNNYQKELQFIKLNELQADVVVRFTGTSTVQALCVVGCADMICTQVRVIRGGIEVEVSGADLVVGDLMVLAAGDILQADGVLVQGYNVRYAFGRFVGVVLTGGVVPQAIATCTLQPSPRVVARCHFGAGHDYIIIVNQ